MHVARDAVRAVVSHSPSRGKIGSTSAIARPRPHLQHSTYLTTNWSSAIAANGDDCNDSEPGVHPGAQELCNDADDNCDGAIDEGAPADRSWYPDADGGGQSDSRRAPNRGDPRHASFTGPDVHRDAECLA